MRRATISADPSLRAAALLAAIGFGLAGCGGGGAQTTAPPEQPLPAPTPAPAPSALQSGPLVQVSGTSPFDGCTADTVPGQTAKVFPDTEVEPSLAINPANPQNLIGSFQQDRWDNGGARGIVIAYSDNGGTSWQLAPLPKITRCSGGTYEHASDPWVSIGPTGVAYQISFGFNVDNAAQAMLVSRSADGGHSWSDPVALQSDTDPRFAEDKPSITADPADPAYAYAVWDRIDSSAGAGTVRTPVWFARTTDGGATWEPARAIFDPGVNNTTIGNQIVALPQGVLLDLFNDSENGNAGNGTTSSGARPYVAVLRSEDRGASWSATPVLVSELKTIGIVDPGTGKGIRSGDIVPEFAVDNQRGIVAAVWQDSRFSNGGHDSIAFSQSRDGGQTWSAPVQVNQTPATLSNDQQQAFTPNVRITADGTVAVTYYDFRNFTAGSSRLDTDYFLVVCHQAASDCSQPSAWGNETRLTDTSFDMRATPAVPEYFIGDYAGMATDGNDILNFFPQSHGSDGASIFFRRTAGQ